MRTMVTLAATSKVSPLHTSLLLLMDPSNLHPHPLDPLPTGKLLTLTTTSHQTTYSPSFLSTIMTSTRTHFKEDPLPVFLMCLVSKTNKKGSSIRQGAILSLNREQNFKTFFALETRPILL
jgi:hypothetical protein